MNNFRRSVKKSISRQLVFKILALLLTLGVMNCPSQATDWAPRIDLGVAAIDMDRGDLLWEAWEPEDLPAGIAEVSRAQVTQLLEQDRSRQRLFEFPHQLTNDRVVTYQFDQPSGATRLILTNGSADKPGGTIATFSPGGAPYISAVAAGSRVYVTFGTTIYALDPPKSSATVWSASWSINFAQNVKTESKRLLALDAPLTLMSDNNGLWAASVSRVARFTDSGEIDFDYNLVAALPATWHSGKRFDAFPPTILPWSDKVFVGLPSGLLAIDRKSAKEVWRRETHRYPYPSLVATSGDGMVFVQVGSDCPQTLSTPLQLAASRKEVAVATLSQDVAAAQLLQRYGEGYHRKAIRQWLSKELAHEGEASKVAVGILAQLLENWPRRRNKEGLVQGIVDALSGKGWGEETGSPARHRILAWRTLQELLFGYPQPESLPPNAIYSMWDELPFKMPPEMIRQLTGISRQVIATGSEEEKGYAASVLLSESLDWSSVSESELKSLLLSNNSSVWRWAGQAMIKHGMRETLLEWGSTRPRSDYFSIFLLLNQGRTGLPSGPEQRFILTLAADYPGDVAYQLQLQSSTSAIDVPTVFRQPFHKYLRGELIAARAEEKAGQVTTITQREYNLNAALRILRKWNEPEDLAIVRSFLEYPHSFVREHAKGML